LLTVDLTWTMQCTDSNKHKNWRKRCSYQLTVIEVSGLQLESVLAQTSPQQETAWQEPDTRSFNSSSFESLASPSELQDVSPRYRCPNHHAVFPSSKVNHLSVTSVWLWRETQYKWPFQRSSPLSSALTRDFLLRTLFSLITSLWPHVFHHHDPSKRNSGSPAICHCSQLFTRSNSGNGSRFSCRTSSGTSLCGGSINRVGTGGALHQYSGSRHARPSLLSFLSADTVPGAENVNAKHPRCSIPFRVRIPIYNRLACAYSGF
jgi:hypothetical protein